MFVYGAYTEMTKRKKEGGDEGEGGGFYKKKKKKKCSHGSAVSCMVPSICLVAPVKLMR